MPPMSCCFLIDAGQLVEADGDLDLVKSPDEAFHNAVELVFRPWREAHCRPAGIRWHKHKALLMNDGRVVQLVPEHDWRERDIEVHAWRDDTDAGAAAIASMVGGDNPWTEKIIVYALRCAASALIGADVGTFGLEREDILMMNRDDVVRWFTVSLPAAIARLYQQEAGNEGGRDEIENRLAVVHAYEAFRSAHLPPFSTRWCRADDYCCFDLRRDPQGPPSPSNAVVLTSEVNVPTSLT